MSLLLLAVLPAITALLLFASLLVSALARTLRGERWAVPLTETSLTLHRPAMEDAQTDLALVS